MQAARGASLTRDRTSSPGAPRLNLLIGVAIAAAITAARFLFGVEQRDE
jgi:hypothetical protein